MSYDHMIQSRELKQPPGYMPSIMDIFLRIGLEQVATLDDDIKRSQLARRLCDVCEQPEGTEQETRWHGRMRLCPDCATGEPNPED